MRTNHKPKRATAQAAALTSHDERQRILVEAPNYTQAPNAILDAAKDMGEAELRVVLHVVRQTWGWHKLSDRISFSQFQKGTGLSRESAWNGVQAAIKHGIIAQKESGNSFIYSALVYENGKLVHNDHSTKSNTNRSAKSNSKKTNVRLSRTKSFGLVETQKKKEISANAPRKKQQQQRGNDADVRSNGLIEHYAEEINQNFGIDMPQARVLAKRECVTRALIQEWKRFSDRDIAASLASDGKKKPLGAGFYVTQLRQGAYP